MKNYKKPLNRSITAGCAIFIFLLCVFLSTVNLSLYRNYVYEDYRGYIKDLLHYTLKHIDGDDLRKCIDTGKESEKYKKTLLLMDDMMNNFDDIHYFYAVLPLNTESRGNMMSVLSAEREHDRYVDTAGNLYLGWISDDEFDAKTAKKFTEIMAGDKTVFFEEATEWGVDYTGAVPIKDSKGNSVAVLALDIDISFINGMILRFALVNIGMIIGLGLVFTLLFLLWSKHNITKPIKKLEHSAVSFADHSHGQRDIAALSFDVPEMNIDNEIKALTEAVVKMTDDMRDYVAEIIDAEKKADSMQQLATIDALTGVRNKRAYDHEFTRLEKLVQEGETKFGMILIDLNFLKRINDNYGHDKGDVAIRTLCRVVCEVFEHSAVFRIGGDEFLIVLQGRDYEHVDELVEQLNAELAKMAEDETLQPWERISAAIGTALYSESLDEGNVSNLFRRADHVMYDCKKNMKALRTE